MGLALGNGSLLPAELKSGIMRLEYARSNVAEPANLGVGALMQS
jgi:hypothetical protein